MRKKYNIFVISRLYLRRYYKFLINETNIRSSVEAKELFLYSLKKIYGLEAVEYNKAIVKYGDSCIKYLEETPNTPKNKKGMSFEDRVRVVSVGEGYVEVTQLLSYKTIQNSRMG